MTLPGPILKEIAMGNTSRNALQKTRHAVTAQGCAVVEKRIFNQQTGCIDHEIALSHPLPIVEVAFSPETLIAKANGVFDREIRR